MLRDTPFKTRMIAVAGVAAIAAAGVALWHTDLLLTRGFGKALEGARPTLTFQPATGRGQDHAGIAGDEGYWLTRAEVESPTPFAKPLALGDRITISGRDGRARELEIVDLKAIAATAGKGQPRLMIVTCRTVGDRVGQDVDRGAVRFIIEAEPVDPGTANPAKTL